jgi:hypothetical protein
MYKLEAMTEEIDELLVDTGLSRTNEPECLVIVEALETASTELFNLVIDLVKQHPELEQVQLEVASKYRN